MLFRSSCTSLILSAKYEQVWWQQGKRCIVGIDEAGRGPIAGPLVVAAVAFPPGYSHPEIYDSKKLSDKKRRALFHEVVAQALEFVSKLPAIAPVYYACGNHEQRMKRKPEVYGEVYQEYQKQLEECGVHFLENSSVLLKEDDCRIRISALELPLATYTKFKKYRVTEQDVTACIEKEAADYEILLAHNPVYFDAYKKWGADLVLSGHLHGGIIRLPGIGGLITPQAIPFPKYSGEMTTEGEQTIIVSRGLGTHTINLRFLNEAEMIVIHLRGEKDS